jgi:hypothetical protein
MEAIWGKQFVGIETYNRRLLFPGATTQKEKKQIRNGKGWEGKGKEEKGKYDI